MGKDLFKRGWQVKKSFSQCGLPMEHLSSLAVDWLIIGSINPQTVFCVQHILACTVSLECVPMYVPGVPCVSSASALCLKWLYRTRPRGLVWIRFPMFSIFSGSRSLAVEGFLIASKPKKVLENKINIPLAREETLCIFLPLASSCGWPCTW